MEGLRPERIKPILDAAIARFHMFSRMRAELATTKAALENAPFGDAMAVGRALSALDQPLRMGVPFAFSMQAELLHYWLERAAPGVAVTIPTVPPPRMSEALLTNEIGGFCVGEPWGS